jgi:hypothetical protein
VHSCSNWSCLNPCWLWGTCESIWILIKLIGLVVRTLITLRSWIGILFGTSNHPQLGSIRSYFLSDNPSFFDNFYFASSSTRLTSSEKNEG